MEMERQNKQCKGTILRNIVEVTQFSTTNNKNITIEHQVEQKMQYVPNKITTFQKYMQLAKKFCSYWCKRIDKPIQLDINQDQFTKEVQKMKKMKLKKQAILPPAEPGVKTLVLDLDETLIHSTFKKCKNYDFAIEINLNGQKQQIYITKRFGLDIFLFQMSQIYELVVYTAGLKEYTDEVLRLIDPKKRIKHVLYREHCIILNKNYFLKNLGSLGRNLKQTILIDDNSIAGIMYPEIFYHIQPFYGSSKDRKLLRLIQFMKEMTKQQNFSILYTRRKQFEKKNNRPKSYLTNNFSKNANNKHEFVKNISVQSDSAQRSQQSTQVSIKSGIDF